MEKNLQLAVNLGNVPCVITLKLTNTAGCPMVINAICVLLARQTFSESFDSLYYRRHVSPEQIQQVLQAHSVGSSLRGVSRTTKLAYNTVVSIVRAASQRAQLVHNAKVQAVETTEVSADELWSFVSKNKSNA